MNELKVDSAPQKGLSEEKVKKPKPFAALGGEEEMVIASLPTPMQMVEHMVILKEEAIASSSTVTLDHLVKETLYCIHHVRESGVMEMRWEIELPRLKNIEIHIRHYETAPDRFHIEIAAQPEIQEYLQKKLPELEEKLSRELVKIPCYFTPITLIKSRPTFGAKSKEERKKVVQSKAVSISSEII